MPNDADDPIVQAKYAKGVLAEEIKFRRDRRQQISSWASSLLVAIIGGSTALNSAKLGQQLGYPQIPILYFAILILCVLSVFWINRHYSKEKVFIAASEKYDNIILKSLEYNCNVKRPSNLYKYLPWDFANILAIIGLTFAALAAAHYNLELPPPTLK